MAARRGTGGCDTAWRVVPNSSNDASSERATADAPPSGKERKVRAGEPTPPLGLSQLAPTAACIARTVLDVVGGSSMKREAANG